MKRSYCIFIIVFLRYFCLCAQELTTTSFGINSPLQTNTIYDIHIATDGLLYIATDNGLWSYDGLKFHKYHQQSLQIQDVTNIQENSLGHIFFQNFKGQIFRWDKERIDQDSTTLKLGFQIKTFQIIEDYTYYWNRDRIVVKQNDSSTIRELLPPNQESWIFSQSSPTGKINRLKDAKVDGPITVIAQLTPYKIIDLKLESRQHIVFYPEYGNEPCVYIPNSTHNGQLITSNKKVLIDLDKCSIKLNPLRVKKIKNRPWLACRNGLYIPYLNKFYLKGFFISEIIEDQEGNIWVSTTNRGLLKLIDEKHTFLPNPTPSTKIDIVYKHKEKILFSNHVGDLFYWSPTTKEPVLFSNSFNKEQIKSIVYLANPDRYVISGYELKIFDTNFQLQNTQKGNYFLQVDTNNVCSRINKHSVRFPLLPLQQSKENLLHKKEYIYPLFKRMFYVYKNGIANNVTWRPQSEVKSSHKYAQWIIALRQDTLTYVHDIHFDSVRNYPIPPSSQKIHVQNNRLWVEFSDQLIEYNEWGEVLNRIPRVNDIEQNITNISIDDKYLVISTKQAICLYDHQTMECIHKFTAENGIASIDFEKGWLYEGALYINGTKGISRIPLDGNYNSGKPKLWIDQVLVNKIENKTTNFEYNQNDIQVYFALRSLTAKGKLYWRLNEKDWKELEGKPQLELEELYYGNYTIEAYFENDLGTKTPIVAYSFTINAPYWQTWWFYTLLNLIGLGVIGWIWKQRLTAKQKEERQQNQVNLLRMQALQTQMNPHFIFNVQSAIQGLWLEDKDEAALALQTDFSKLLRKIFQYSAQPSISIDQLIDFLNNYINLEKIRFEEAIEVELKIDQSLFEEDYLIPPLLLQPILENSFKHGLLHKKGPKKLVLELSNKTPYLYAVVTDNGVGRGPQMPHELQRASGLKTTQERLDILQQSVIKQPHPYHNINIKDLKDAQGQSLGTQVELWIPFVDFKQ